jgi:uncharacterized membrane protein YhaH (DUF805 family)
MTLQHYFVSPFGRIGRQEFWLGMLGIMALTLLAVHVLDPLGFQPSPDGKIRPPSLGSTVFNLLLSWPTTAIMIKRFNDRDRPYWVGLALGAAMVVLVIANFLGLMLDPDRMSLVERALLFSGAIAFTWALIENGFLAGTNGPNRYGADPLAGRATSGE